MLAGRYLKNRIAAFANLPLGSLDRMTIAAQVREIGHMPGASHGRPELA